MTIECLLLYCVIQDSRPTGTIPLVSNKVIRHPDDPKQPSSFKFEIMCELCAYVNVSECFHSIVILAL